MNTKNAILNILLKSNTFVSGEVIAKRLNISRVAVNKAVEKLRQDGYVINSVTNKGYMLETVGSIDANVIKSKTNYSGEVIVLNETVSTNVDAKIIAERGETAVVIAKTQTGGKGRLNRKFYSLTGGAYLSVIVKPNLPIADGVKITTYTAVAVANVIEKLTGLKVDIKWVNDLYVNGKKICGILTEASCDFEQNKLKYAVVGIGVNLDAETFPLEIENIATSVYKEGKIKVDKNQFIAEILNAYSNLEGEIKSGNYLQEYKRRCFILGKKVTVYQNDYSYLATALDVTESGALKVDKNGEIITVSSGEVSIKL